MTDNPPASEYLDVDGVRLHFQTVGEGSPVVLLHGGGPGASSWTTFAGNADALARGHRLVFLDLPGFGKSPAITLPTKPLALLAHLIGGAAASLGFENIDLIGNSRGGQVGLKLAIDRPTSIRRLVTLGSVPGVVPPITPTPVEAVKLITDYYKDDGPSLAKMRHLMKTMVYDPTVVTDAMIDDRYAASVENSVLTAGGTPAPPAESLESDLDRVSCPTLIVWGHDDRAGAIDAGLVMLRRIPNARMHVFGRCGHWAQFEYPDEFNALVSQFLA
jgi:2-hydroxy-6-oxonona-2,4-dienedioate hydrolase/4,5:9,10-diseco-3-hydroxy-5,9,17-trioxoandrosta-1(10),2-diene-4-oate hydrolase